MKTRVLLADDHTIVRAGLRALVEALGLEVVADVGRGDEALAAILALRPDVALLDASMPGLTGPEVVERASSAAPETRCLILSMYASETYVAQALAAGARGYLLKDAALADLPAALEAAARGETFLSPGVSRVPLDEHLAVGTGGPLDLLTPRQRDVLRRIAEGQGTKEIAFELGLSPKTVETHRLQLMAKLGIHDVASLVRLAVRTGLVTPDR